jgi:hypothetical protein
MPEPPAEGGWRENYCFDGYDPVTDIGFWIHMGRWPHDPGLWREQVLVYALDGTFVLHRGWGVRDSVGGPKGALLELTCLQPGAEWHIGYRGPARRTRPEELSGPLPEIEQGLLELDLTFSTRDELWLMGHEVEGQEWANAHGEHTGRVAGTLRVGGAEPIPVDSFAWRDHSRGPRNLTGHRRHCWIHGELPGGRTFALTTIESQNETGEGENFAQAVVWSAGKAYAAECPSPPYIDRFDVPPDGYTMRLKSEVGTFEITAETPRSLPHSTMVNGDAVDGVARAGAHIVTWEQGTVFRVDGGSYAGHSERSHWIPR